MLVFRGTLASKSAAGGEEIKIVGLDPRKWPVFSGKDQYLCLDGWRKAQPHRFWVLGGWVVLSDPVSAVLVRLREGRVVLTGPCW